jgi:catechol 2,3-dioxygenase-like lactoylglutathione lyase family enzyme
VDPQGGPAKWLWRILRDVVEHVAVVCEAALVYPWLPFELFVYVDEIDEVDEVVGRLRGGDGRVLKEPEDMFWGERVAYVADPDGNPVALAVAAGSA